MIGLNLKLAIVCGTTLFIFYSRYRTMVERISTMDACSIVGYTGRYTVHNANMFMAINTTQPHAAAATKRASYAATHLTLRLYIYNHIDNN